MAGTFIQVEVDDREVLDLLQKLQKRVSDLTPALRDIAEELQNQTRARFDRQVAPGGTAWAPNSPVTIEQFLRGNPGIRKSGYARGKKIAKASLISNRRLLNDAGVTLLRNKKILRQSNDLMTTFRSRIVGNTLFFGSNQTYAAAQQFGMKKGQAGRTRRGTPIPWGDIPARPFLGLTNDDKRDVLARIRDHLARPL